MVSRMSVGLFGQGWWSGFRRSIRSILPRSGWRGRWLRRRWCSVAAYPDQTFSVFINCQLLEQQLFAQIIEKSIITVQTLPERPVRHSPFALKQRDNLWEHLPQVCRVKPTSCAPHTVPLPPLPLSGQEARIMYKDLTSGSSSLILSLYNRLPLPSCSTGKNGNDRP